MGIHAGRFRHRIAIQELTEGQDSVSGEVTKSWSTVSGCESVPAEVVFLSAKEFIASQTRQTQIVARITIRYRAGVSAKHRIVFRSQVYEIEGALPDLDSGLEYLTLLVSQGVTDG